MRRKRKKSQNNAEIPMASMIDVVFLLLIYFVFTQKPIIEDTLLGINFAPPGKAASKQQMPSTLFSIEVKQLSGDNNENIYLLNGRKCDFQLLERILKEAAANDPQTTVIIKCGDNARHAKLIRLLDLCKTTGITKITLAES